jgi:sequestosome 1
MGLDDDDLHENIICNGCRGEVRSFRYNCSDCDNYDLCSSCDGKGVHKVTFKKSFLNLTSPGVT